MRRGFEFALRQYNTEIGEIEKAKITGDEQKLQQETLELEKVLGRRAEASASSTENQREILEIQKEKREIFLELKKSFRDLEAGKLEDEPELIKLSYDSATRFLKGRSKQGKEFLLTIGELFSNVEWDIFSNLDGSVPRHIRKEYLFVRARKKIRDLLDAQILLEETANQRSERGRREAYKKMKEAIDEDRLVSGWIAENAVRGFLSCLAMDFGLRFEVDRADVFMDVDHKVDFVLRRPRYHRGVGIEREDQSGRESGEGKQEELKESETDFDNDKNNGWGIQFTTSTTSLDLSRKRKQMLYARAYLPENKLKDLVLVSIPLGKVKNNYLRWLKSVKETGVSFGGPEQYWNERVQHELVDGLLKIFIPNKGLERIKQIISDREELRQRRMGEAFGWPVWIDQGCKVEGEIDEFDGLGLQDCYEKMARKWRRDLGERKWRLFKKFAEQTGTSTETQDKIFQLIEKKVEIRTSVNRAAKALDKAEVQKTKRDINCDLEEGTFFRLIGGDKIIMSVGDIMSSLAWGLVPNFGPSVPKDIRIDVLTRQSEERLRKLDDQITLALETGRIGVDEETKKRYQENFRELFEIQNSSVLRSRSVVSFLERLSIDFGLEFFVRIADLKSRVEEGTDLIIEFRDKIIKIKTNDLPFGSETFKDLSEWRAFAKRNNMNISPDFLWPAETQIKMAESILGSILSPGEMGDVKELITLFVSANRKRIKSLR